MHYRGKSIIIKKDIVLLARHDLHTVQISKLVNTLYLYSMLIRIR